MQRHIYDQNQPQGSMSLENLRNALRGLFQGDLMPFRPRASMVLDEMEYNTDALAQAQWSGTGVTVTKSTTKQDGVYSIQAVIDATPNRELANVEALDLSLFSTIKIWDRCNDTSQSFRFYLEDSLGNRSYWDLTSNGSADTWQQDEITLASPDGDSGTPADLSDVAEWGFYQLPASKTFLFDTVKALCGLNVAVEAGFIGSFYQQVYVGFTRVTHTGGSSPAITPPAANPRIDLLVLNQSNALEWVTGTEDSSPAEPTFPTDKLPICLVYCRTTMTKVVDYEDAAANPNEAYIYKDVRPLFAIPAIT